MSTVRFAFPAAPEGTADRVLGELVVEALAQEDVLQGRRLGDVPWVEFTSGMEYSNRIQMSHASLNDRHNPEISTMQAIQNLAQAATNTLLQVKISHTWSPHKNTIKRWAYERMEELGYSTEARMELKGSWGDSGFWPRDGLRPYYNHRGLGLCLTRPVAGRSLVHMSNIHTLEV